MAREVEPFWVENPEWERPRKLVVLASAHDEVVRALQADIATITRARDLATARVETLEKQLRMEKTRQSVRVVK